MKRFLEEWKYVIGTSSVFLVLGFMIGSSWHEQYVTKILFDDGLATRDSITMKYIPYYEKRMSTYKEKD